MEPSVRSAARQETNGPLPLATSAPYTGLVRMRLLATNGVLFLALVALAAVLEVVDHSSVLVESTVSRYAQAISSNDPDTALAEIAPDRRSLHRGFVLNQLGNVYVVRVVAVRTPSLLERVAHPAARGPVEVTVVLDVDPGDPLAYYQPTTRVPVEEVDGRWYLSAPLLQPATLK